MRFYTNLTLSPKLVPDKAKNMHLRVKLGLIEFKRADKRFSSHLNQYFYLFIGTLLVATCLLGCLT